MEASNYSSDEISLLALWWILLRRKSVLLAIWGACLLLGASYLVVWGPVYQARAVVKVGRIDLKSFIEDPSVLTARVILANDANEGSPPLVSAGPAKHAPSQFIELVVHDWTAEGAKHHVDRLVGQILAEHDAAIARTIGALIERKKKLDEDLRRFGDSIDRRISTRQPFNQPRDSAAASYTMYVGDENLLLVETKLNSERSEIDVELNTIEPTRVITASTEGKRDLRRYAFILGWSAILGFMLGIFGVVAAEIKAASRMRSNDA